MNEQDILKKNIKSLPIKEKLLLRSLIIKVQCERHFYDFIKRAWPIIDSAEFKDNWHIGAIAEHLEAIAIRQIRRLIINIPPRCSKSLICSVLFPVWVWIKNPKEKFLTGSHAREFAINYSRLSRVLIESEWVQQTWGDKIAIRPDQNQKSFYENISGGYRDTFSTGGDPLGKGGSFLGFDDPISFSDVYSKAKRDSVNNVINSSCLNRLNDPINDPVFLVQQRLHPRDTTSNFIEADIHNEWIKLILPMEFEAARRCKTFIFTDPRTEEGEILCDRFNKKLLDEKKAAMGAADYNAQYQQRPEIPEGNIIKASDFVRYDKCPEDIEYIIQGWDTAFKTGEKNDYSVCLTIAVTKNSYYFRDMFRDKIAYPRLKSTAEFLAERYRPRIILIEDKASGQSLIQDLRDTTRLPIIAIKIDKDKVSRANSITGLIASGKVFIPNNESWIYDFIDEVSLFPYGAHDDIVDTLTMLLNYLQGNDIGCPRVVKV